MHIQLFIFWSGLSRQNRSAFKALLKIYFVGYDDENVNFCELEIFFTIDDHLYLFIILK